MKKLHLSILAATLIAAGCQPQTESVDETSESKSTTPQVAVTDLDVKPDPVTENPFFEEYATPFGVPEFASIRIDHYRPAFARAFDEQRIEVAAITANPEAASFDNTIVALERSGPMLTKVANVFFNLNSADTSDELQEIATEISPKLAALGDEIFLNADLFDRVKTVWESRVSLSLDDEQRQLLSETNKNFVRAGANLDSDKKQRLTEINQKLASLTTKFSQNLLADENRFELVLEESDLGGLPESVRAAGKAIAEQKELGENWVYTLSRTSITPFLTYSDRRNLRQKMFQAYIARGSNGNEFDNREILREMANLRLERANLLGYASHADYILEDRMAKSVERVNGLLTRVWPAALERAKHEAQDLQEMITSEGGDFKLQAWDWWYFSEKVRKARFALDEEQLRQYFVTANVRQAVFDTASRLFGISFVEQPEVPVYNPDVKAFEVLNGDGSHLGVLYNDYYARPSKRGGAWMNEFRTQHREDGAEITPVVTNVFNFSKPAPGKPSLLSWDEVNTVFHEFGHAIHGLFSDVQYEGLAGTNTPRDFVEYPSQVMENWAAEPEVMRRYARHYETGEVIPDELIERIQNARLFNQGFATVEYLAASLLDLAWHSITEPVTETADEFEARVMQEIGAMPEIVSRYRSPYFAHIFAGGYSAGYYSYIWSEVMDADTYEAFKESGIFDQGVAGSFRDHILSKGRSRDLMEQYKKFRGREPQIGPLLERRGLTGGPAQ